MDEETPETPETRRMTGWRLKYEHDDEGRLLGYRVVYVYDDGTES